VKGDSRDGNGEFLDGEGAGGGAQPTTQGGEGPVLSSHGWRRRRAGTGGRHTMAQHKEGEGPISQPTTVNPRSTRRGGAAPPTGDGATRRGEGLAAGRCVGDSHKGPLITREKPIFAK
jgi:hypothetical protein